MSKNNGITIQDFIDDRQLELRAFKSGVRDAMRKHKAAGVPIAVWEDGKVKIIPPDEIVVPEEAD